MLGEKRSSPFAARVKRQEDEAVAVSTRYRQVSPVVIVDIIMFYSLKGNLNTAQEFSSCRKLAFFWPMLYQERALAPIKISLF
jgi:hypothetical protein